MTEVPKNIRAGLGLAGVVLLLSTIVVVLNYGQGYYDKGYEVSAVFPSSSQGIYTDGGTAVKMRGIDIGQVSSVELLEDGRARLTFFIYPHVEIPQTASAAIEPLSVFGPKFIQLVPGAGEGSGDYLDDGDEITQATVAPELTDILDGASGLFDQVKPEQVIAIFDAVATGVDGMGDTLGDTIANLRILAGLGARHTEDLRQFLTDVAALSDTFADRADQMVTTIDNLSTLLPVLTENQADVRSLLESTTSISTTFSQLLDDNTDQFALAVDGIARFLDGVYRQAADLPDFLDLVATFFGGLAAITRFDGPEGSLMAGLRGFISLDACLLTGICPASAASATSTPTLIGPAEATALATLVPSAPTPTASAFGPLLTALLSPGGVG